MVYIMKIYEILEIELSWECSSAADTFCRSEVDQIHRVAGTLRLNLPKRCAVMAFGSDGATRSNGVSKLRP